MPRKANKTQTITPCGELPPTTIKNLLPRKTKI
nr:MAG TPA: hypothetical protein [Caudoviricetes sp.]